MHAFDVLGDPVRRRILELLARGEQPAGSVVDAIQAEFGISQPAVSQHLRVLRESGFATVRADGTRRLYAVDTAAFQEVDQWIDRFRSFWAPPLAALATEIKRGKREVMSFAIDVDHQINAVARTLGARTHDAGELRVVTVSQAYDTTVEDLWEAVTTAERIERWFLPVTGDLRLGGRYQLVGNAGGEITACDPPHGFDATWVVQMEGMDEPAVSWIEVRITDDGDGRARFTLGHVAQVDDAMWDQFGPGAVGIGWDQGLLGLVTHLSSGGERVDPAEAMAWMASEDGKRFSTLAGEGWYAAEVAAGDDEVAARRHADASIAAYTSWDPTAEG